MNCQPNLRLVAGDGRVNMYPQLAALHTLWLREHNRVARALHILNPSWSHDVLYHEARRIVVAELQHITYTHWLPAITGIYPHCLPTGPHYQIIGCKAPTNLSCLFQVKAMMRRLTHTTRGTTRIRTPR